VDENADRVDAAPFTTPPSESLTARDGARIWPEQEQPVPVAGCAGHPRQSAAGPGGER